MYLLLFNKEKREKKKMNLFSAVFCLLSFLVQVKA